MSDSVLDTLVVGAGISGLAFAWERLRLREGTEVLVLEASTRPGGLVRTVSEQGFRFEEGPEALPGGARGLRELCLALDLPLQEAPPAAAKRFIHLGRKLIEVPGSPDDLTTSRVLSFGAKLRLMAESTCARDEALDGSIADFARHRFGKEALERVVDPLVAGIHAGDPEQLSLRACFPEVVQMVEEHGSITAAMKARARAKKPGAPRSPLGGNLFKPSGGMETLIAALARALGTRLRCNSRVERIEAVEGAFRVTEASGARHVATKVVLAVPLESARKLLAEVAPEATEALADMRSESLVSMVHAYPRRSVEHALDGFGYLVPASAGGLVLGTLFSSTLDPESAPDGQVLLRSLVGGSRNPDAVALSEEELQAAAHEECAGPLGLSAQPTYVRVARWPNAIPRFDLQHPARLRRMEAALPPNLGLLGNFTRALGLEQLSSHAKELAERL